MKRTFLVILMVTALVSVVFANEVVSASDYSYLENFQVKEGDVLCTFTNLNFDDKVVEVRIYLNEDKSDPSYACNGLYKALEDGAVKDIDFEVVNVSYQNVGSLDYFKGTEVDGKSILSSLELDLNLFSVETGINIDEEGSYYFGYDVSFAEVLKLQGEMMTSLLEG